MYMTSKCFVNAYNRFVLYPLLKEDQTCFVVHPGWVQTDMGGSNADLKPEEGAVSALTCVDFSLEEAKKHNSGFFDEYGKPFSF